MIMQKSLKLYQSLENLSLNRSEDELRDNKACSILSQLPKYLLDAAEVLIAFVFYLM